MTNTLLSSTSLRPYLYIFATSVALLVLALVLNIGSIGALFGGAISSIDFRYEPLFTLGVIAIYFIRKTYVSILAAVVFAILYQIYFVEFSETWRLLGMRTPSYFSFQRIYGAVLLLSFIGSCHAWMRKYRGNILLKKTNIKA